MVLTNFECWALGGGGGGSGVSADLDVAASRHVDPFNPRAVQQSLGPVPSAESTAGSHISSNGYYGFSHVNAAHEMNNNNNNNNVNLNNNNNDETCHNNNNISAGGYVAPIPSTRCKKRFFVNDDALVAANFEGNHVADESLHSHGLVAAAKRCRYDDDFAAQYFNDFFTMQAAAQPIGTQACLMDTEDFSQFHQQQQQQHPATLQPQVDVAMTTSLQTNNDPTNDVECNFSATTPINCNNNYKYNNHTEKMQADYEINVINIFCESDAARIKKQFGQQQEHRENCNSNSTANVHDSSAKVTTTIPTATAALNDESNASNEQLLQPPNSNANLCNSNVETLYTAIHGGSRYYCWQQYCSNIYVKPNNAADENFYEEF